MSEEMIIRNCAPTLAGIKTGSMFSCPFKSSEELKSSVRFWNKRLLSKGLRVIPLKFSGNSALIYIYRPIKLKKDLQDKKACKILSRCGYKKCSADQSLARLIKRMEKGADFPHEIGLFLGYPPEDVKGFMDNKSKNCLFVGYWKVYSNKQKAKKTFAKYKLCTDIFTARYFSGETVERLTAAVGINN